MGFGKRIKKVGKKVGKVVKKAAPIALSAAGAYFGGPAGAAVGKKLGNMIGGENEFTKAAGNVVSDTISGTANSIAQGMGAKKQSSGVSMPNNYNGSANPKAPNPVEPPRPVSNPTEGMAHIANAQTPIKSAAEQGKDTKDYLAAAYPNMNEWERSGTGGTMFGSEMTGDIQSQEAQNKQLSTQANLQNQMLLKDMALAKLNSDTQLAVNQNNNQTALEAAYLASQTSLQNAGIQSQTSRLNTRDTLSLGYQNSQIARERLNADVYKIAADTDMSIQARKESISREIKTYAETNNIRLSASQIEAMTNESIQRTRESGARTGLIGAQTGSEYLRQPGIVQTNENLRYGQGTMAKEALSIGNAIGDSASGMWDSIKDFFGKKSDGVSIFTDK